MWSLVWPLVRSWLLRRALTLLGWLALATAVLAVLLGARRAGRKAERVEQFRHAIEIRHRQLAAALKRPRTRDELSRSMLDGSY